MSAALLSGSDLGGLSMKDGLEATTLAVADDVADATTLPAQRNPAARPPVFVSV